MPDSQKSWPWPNFHLLRRGQHAAAREAHEKAATPAVEPPPARSSKAAKSADAAPQDFAEGDGAGGTA